ncbi:MAG: AAA family ATPase [Bryobacterales bacterium]|nr:AAA family ATPase [Bryobacterales bacterium]
MQFSINGQMFSRWTVILGDNGVGKTTILRGIAHFGHRQPPDKLPEQAELTLELAADPPLRIASSQIRQSSDLPTIYAYGAGRGVHTARLAPTSIHPAATLFDDGAALPDAEEWWLQTDYAVRVSNDESARKHLERVSEALVKLLPDVTGIGVQLDEQKQPRLMADTIHGRVLLRDLSLGYNTALTWVIDLARRMFERYPNSPDPLAEPAVVLVDEIDLHLHPRWQRELLQTLDRIFSKTQFIVTAHSPLIVQAAPNANLALLRWEGDQVVIDNDVDYIRKWRVDQILSSELFGEQPTHAPEVEELIEQKLELASKPELTEEEQLRLQELDEELAHIPTAANPSDIDAMRIIREAAEALKAKSGS